MDEVAGPTIDDYEPVDEPNEETGLGSQAASEGGDAPAEEEEGEDLLNENYMA